MSECVTCVCVLKLLVLIICSVTMYCVLSFTLFESLSTLLERLFGLSPTLRCSCDLGFQLLVIESATFLVEIPY